MVKKRPNLRLIQQEAERDLKGLLNPEEEFSLLSLNELSSAEKSYAERFISEVAPDSGIIGIVETPRTWDIRPVVKVRGDDTPSIIRLLGPEVALTVEVRARINDLLDHFESNEELKSTILDYGVFEGQIWYRRQFADLTLQDLFQNQEVISLERARSLGGMILKAVGNLHARGIIHGHIYPANIALSKNVTTEHSSGSLTKDDISLIDTGIRVALIEASIESKVDNVSDYLVRSLSPEMGVSKRPRFATDVYGLGLVLNGLFSKVEFTEVEAGRFTHTGEFISSMMDADPDNRPKLKSVVSTLGKFLKPRRRKPKSGSTLSKNKSANGGTSLNKPLSADKKTILVGKENKPKENDNRGDNSTIDQNEDSSGSPKIKVAREIKPTTLMRATNISNFTEMSALEAEPKSEKKVDAPRSEVDDSFLSDLEVQTEDTSAKNIFASEDERSARLDLGESSSEEEVAARAKKVVAAAHGPSNFAYLMASAFILAFSIFLYFNFGSQEYDFSNDELAVAWSSGLPSKMQIVAEAAVDEDAPNFFAESLIVKSAQLEDVESQSFNSELVRIAFDPRWEKNLADDDKQVALSLALAKILDGQGPKNFKSTDSLHPGVILALAASGGDRATRFLEGIPTSRLFELPAPVSSAFKVLGKEGENMDCGSDSVRILARISARGIVKGFKPTEELHSFVSSSPKNNTQALAVLFSKDEQSASSALVALLKHPNLKPNAPRFRWAMRYKFADTEWNNISSSERLMMLGGLNPVSRLTKSQLETLFLHPDSDVRAAAIARALERFQWNHPGAVMIFKVLLERPDTLSAIQTARLAPMLSEPSKVPGKVVEDWLSGKPPLALVEALLLSTYAQSEATELDFAFSQYLFEQGWKPNRNQVKKLSVHPDRVTRLRAYEEIFKFEDKVLAVSLLEIAKEEESDLEFIDALEEKIEYLKESHAKPKAVKQKKVAEPIDKKDVVAGPIVSKPSEQENETIAPEEIPVIEPIAVPTEEVSSSEVKSGTSMFDQLEAATSKLHENGEKSLIDAPEPVAVN